MSSLKLLPKNSHRNVDMCSEAHATGSTADLDKNKIMQKSPV
jgi:hypothetical protein